MGDTRITKVAEVRFLKFLAALNRGWWFSATVTVCRILENLQFIPASPDDAERRAGEMSPPCRLEHSWRRIAITPTTRYTANVAGRLGCFPKGQNASGGCTAFMNPCPFSGQLTSCVLNSQSPRQGGWGDIRAPAFDSRMRPPRQPDASSKRKSRVWWKGKGDATHLTGQSGFRV